MKNVYFLKIGEMGGMKMGFRGESGKWSKWTSFSPRKRHFTPLTRVRSTAPPLNHQILLGLGKRGTRLRPYYDWDIFFLIECFEGGTDLQNGAKVVPGGDYPPFLEAPIAAQGRVIDSNPEPLES